MLIGILCQRGRENFLRLLRFIMDYLFQEIRDHRCHEFMTKIIGMKEICRNLLCRQSSGCHSGIDTVLHTDAGQIIMSSYLRMIICRTFTGIIINAVQKYHCRTASAAVNLPYESFIRLHIMGCTVIIHREFHHDQIRQPLKQVFLYSRRAELGIGSSDSGVHIIKFRIGKHFPKPCNGSCSIAFIRSRRCESLRNGSTDESHCQSLPFGCPVQEVLQPRQIPPVQYTCLFINNISRTFSVFIYTVIHSVIPFCFIFQCLADPEDLLRPVSSGFQVINATV